MPTSTTATALRRNSAQRAVTDSTPLHRRATQQLARLVLTTLLTGLPFSAFADEDPALLQDAESSPVAHGGDAAARHDKKDDGSTASADVEVFKHVDESHPVCGSTVVFTLWVRNRSDRHAVAVEVTDRPGSGFTITGSSGDGAFDAATGIWSVQLAKGETATRDVEAVVLASGNYRNVAEVTTASLPDPDSVPGDGRGDDFADVTVEPCSSPGPDGDGDGVADATDLDDDNDGLPDTDEGDGATDQDGDGRPDSQDTDADGDGIPDTVEAGSTDTDGDGEIDGFTDDNGNGLDDRVETDPLPRPDSDGDGNTDELDIDSDADGLIDTTEAGTAPNVPVDSDADGRPDYLDIDADTDGIVDNEEAQPEGGYLPPSGADIDDDGLDDAYDADLGSTDPAASAGLDQVNTDGTDLPDYLDADTDNDSVPDTTEGSDANLDGQPDVTPAGADADGDGLDDAWDIVTGPAATPAGSNAPRQDADGDGTRDWRDADDDNDGTPTVDEDPNGNGDPTDDDSDGDGTPDYLDPDDQSVGLAVSVGGVVYDALSRQPIAGAELTLADALGAPLPDACVEPARQLRTTDATGAYRFELTLDAAPACRPEATYQILVDGPPGYRDAPSALIPPDPELDPTGPANPYPVQPQPTAPQVGEATGYHLLLTLAADDPLVINNHIPLDAVGGQAVQLTKRADRSEVAVGELVRYSVTLDNIGGTAIAALTLEDTLPPGFALVENSVRLDGTTSGFSLTSAAPLVLTGIALGPGEQRTLSYVLQVGAGVTGGRYRNTIVAALGGTPVSNDATATVTVVANPEFEQATIIGKVFDDADGDGWQDPGEEGIAGVRLATVTGLLIETDAFGRFHLAAEDVPNLARGRNFYLKLDPSSLPAGSRVTTENPRVQRITQGMLNRFDFGVERPVAPLPAAEPMRFLDFEPLLFEPAGTTLTESGEAALRSAAATLSEFDCGTVEITGIAGTCPLTVMAPVDYTLTTQFDVLSAELHPEDRAVLDRIAAEWQGRTVLRIAVTGHASSEPISARNRGIFSDNYVLSEARARAVGLHIAAALGVPEERIEVAGRGAEMPVASNTTDAGRRRNRRAEIEIVGGAVERCNIADFDTSRLAEARAVAVADALSGALGSANVCRVVADPLATADCEDCGGFLIETASLARDDLSDTNPAARIATLSATIPPRPAPAARVSVRAELAPLERRLAVTAPAVAMLADDGSLQRPVEFRTLLNYPAFVDRLELALYGRNDIARSAPVARLDVPVLPNGTVSWAPADRFAAGTELVAELRAIGADGAVDTSAPVGLKLVSPAFAGRVDIDAADYAELTARAAPANAQILINGNRVRIHGTDVPPGATVTIDGNTVPVDESGAFAAELLMPYGQHELDVAVSDAVRTSHQSLPVDVAPDAFFIAALADLTASTSDLEGAVEPLSGDEDFAEDSLVEGRLALYLKGKVRGRYLLTAQVDTGEEELSELIGRLDEKDPRTLFRHLDPDRYYPVYGDDSTTIDDTDSLGKFYVRVDWDRSQALWGNYHTNLTDTEFAQYSRSLYGAELEYRSRAVSEAQGEARITGTAFASEAQTALGHDEFLGTGGSLYYLRNADVVFGSEKVRVEIRERDSSRVLENVVLTRGVDYEIDELQGRLLLSRPLSQISFKSAPSIVRDRPLDGDRTLLVVDYEYVPAGFDADNVTAGGRGRFWIGDRVQIGTTYVNEGRAGADYALAGVDLTLKAGEGSYLKIEGARTDASQTNVYFSDNGGLTFSSSNRIDPATGTELAGARTGDATGIEARLDLREQGLTDRDWVAAAWWRNTDAGFSIARRDLGVETEETGFELGGTLGDRLTLNARGNTVEAGNYDSTRLSVELEKTAGRNRIAGEVRQLDETDPTVAASYDATLAALRYTRSVSDAVELYAVAQTTVDDDDGAYAENDLVGIGARARVADRIFVAAEHNDGDRGEATQVSLDYRMTPDRTIYGTYTMSADTTFTSPYREQFAIGQRSGIGDQTQVFAEVQFVDDDAASGLAHVFGLDFGLGRTWGLGFTAQQGELSAASGAVDRDAFGISGTFEGDRWQWRSAVESRTDSGAENRHQVITSHRIDRIFSDAFRLLFRLNVADTDDDVDPSAAARFVEGSIGLAFRPTSNDRFNWLGKYTVLHDLPSAAQTLTDSAQRSEILSFEGVYRLNPRWDLGAKLAARTAEVRQSRSSGPWYDSDAELLVLRGTFHVLHRWDALAEYRLLDVSANGGRREGFLVGFDRHLNERVKLGVGYNFTDFSDDLRILDYDRRGWFLNVVGKY